MKFAHVPKIGDVYVIRSKMYNDGGYDWVMQPGDKVVINASNKTCVIVVDSAGKYWSVSTKHFSARSQLL